MAAALAIADGDLAVADPLLLPALDVKEHNGWRISYRTVTPEAKTFQEYRPRLQKMNQSLAAYLIQGVSRHKAILGRLAAAKRNANICASRAKARRKVRRHLNNILS